MGVAGDKDLANSDLIPDRRPGATIGRLAAGCLISDVTNAC